MTVSNGPTPCSRMQVAQDGIYLTALQPDVLENAVIERGEDEPRRATHLPGGQPRPHLRHMPHDRAVHRRLLCGAGLSALIEYERSAPRLRDTHESGGADRCDD